MVFGVGRGATERAKERPTRAGAKQGPAPALTLQRVAGTRHRVGSAGPSWQKDRSWSRRHTLVIQRVLARVPGHLTP